jgi:hypothetical protein
VPVLDDAIAALNRAEAGGKTIVRVRP